MSATKLSEQKKENSNTRQPTVVVTDKENRQGCKDGGRGWQVCFSAALLKFVVLGIHNSFGILYIVFVREYQWSKAFTGRMYLSRKN